MTVCIASFLNVANSSIVLAAVGEVANSPLTPVTHINITDKFKSASINLKRCTFSSLIQVILMLIGVNNYKTAIKTTL